MHNPESILFNEIHKIPWDFEMQTDHLIPARQPELVIVNKKENLPNSGLCEPQSETKESEKTDK